MLPKALFLYVQNEYSAQGRNLDAMQMQYILISGLKMLGLALIGVIAAIAVTFFSAQVAAVLGRNLRKQYLSEGTDIFRHRTESFFNGLTDHAKHQ